MANNEEKKRLRYPVIVEGRYDKSTLLSIFSATVVTTDGFSVFNSREKQSLIKKLAERGGIILLTDSDAGGRQIRTFLTKILPKDKIYSVYVPEIFGKEKRKSAPSKAGLLGVEGMGREVLEKVLSPFVATDPCEEFTRKSDEKPITKMDLWRDGLSGGEGSAEKRAALAHYLGFPSDISAKALIEAMNLVVGYDGYEKALFDLGLKNQG